MHIWILRPIETLPITDDPWNPWYDKAFGFVIRAKTEEDARRLAHEEAGGENRGEFMGRENSKTREPWLDPKYTDCSPLSDEGEAGVLLKDFASA